MIIDLELNITMRFVSILLLIGFGKDKGIISSLGGIGHCFEEVMSCWDLIWDGNDSGIWIEWVLANVDVEW